MRVAYFINQYPAVSHSFIRREIRALEMRGLHLTRIAIRGWDSDTPDADDEFEKINTSYILKNGARGLIAPALWVSRRNPIGLINALLQAIQLSKGSKRHFGYHIIYLLEACWLVHACQKKEINHAHAHFGTNTTEVLLLARLLGGPSFSFTVHGPEEFDDPAGLHLREKIEASAFTIAISSFCRSQLMRWVEHEHWHKIHIVHCGLDAKFLNPEEPLERFNRRLVCVGRLCEQKGQLLLLDAVRRLRDDGREFQLILAGDGDMRETIEQKIDEHDLRDCVEITGWLSADEVKQQLSAAHAMILPSFAEGLPVVIMEAMALSKPVITTYVAGIPELIQHEKHGWLVPAGDEVSIAQAIETCLDVPPLEYARIGSEARQRILERHDVNQEAAKLLTLFQQVASEKMPNGVNL